MGARQEGRDYRSAGNKHSRASGFCLDGVVSVAIDGMAGGPGVADGRDTALITASLKS